MNKSYALILFLVLTGCAKSDYVYFNTDSQTQRMNFTTAIKEVSNTGSVDVLWIIDNSGSMGPHQQTVIRNTAAFMQDFAAQSVHWKMGLISTDTSDAPYLGFAPTDQFTYRDANPNQRFASAVARLGTNGDAIEKVMDPLVQQIQRFPGFLTGRGTPLALVIVTDAEEQSRTNYTANRAALTAAMGSSPLFVYGALWANELQCAPTGSEPDPTVITGTAFEFLMQSAKFGEYFPLCRDFGASIAAIGKQIVQRISRSSIPLKGRPILDTLQVFYKDQPLKPGPKDQGGFWEYDYDLNAVLFHDLDFSTSDNDSVRIEYDSGE